MDRFECFTYLSPNVYLHDPFLQKASEPCLMADPQHPDTIVLCTWPNAKPYQIARYTSGYASLFPTSRILLIEADFETLPSSSSSASSSSTTHSKPRASDPLHAAALALLPTSYALPISRNLCFNPARRRTLISTARRGVLLHLFSTPGAQRACALARAYRAAFAGRALDVQAVIFDAIPVIAHDWSRDASILFYDGLRAGVASMLDGVLAWALGGGDGAASRALGAPHADPGVAAALARDLSDRSLLRQGPRHCYVYPERNTIETWKATGTTGGKVERIDWFVLRDLVDVDREEGGMGVDERRYWGAIEELWY